MVFSFPSTDADMSEILFVSDHARKNCLVQVLLAELFFVLITMQKTVD